MPDQPPLPAAFCSTAWTVIREAQSLPAQDRPAILGPVLCRYWKPIYAYYLSKCRSQEDAEDLVQGFWRSFSGLTESLQVNEDAGRFRDWLVVCAYNYMLDTVRKAKAKKRQPVGGLVSFSNLRDSDGDPFEPAAYDDPNKAFRDAWRLIC